MFLVALVAGACGDSGSSGSTTTTEPSGTAGGTTAATATTAPQPVKGGTLTMVMGAEVRGLDPIAVTGSSALGGEPYRMNALYDSLVNVDNASGEVKPNMAESLTTTDRIIYTLKLKSGIKFSDGTVYDAEAVKYNWERHADPANNSTALALMKTIKSIEVVDPSTLKITLTAENGQFPRSVAGQLTWIGSPTAIKSKGNAGFANAPVGAGPFILKSWTRDSRMEFVRNDTYYKTGQPYLDGLIFRVLPDTTQQVNSVVNGEADMALLSQLPIQKTAKDAGLSITFVAGIGASGMNFNLQKEPFNDARVRRAIAMAIDPARLNQVATDGLGDPVTSWFGKESAWYDTAGEFPKYDQAGAQKLIDAYVAEKGKDVSFAITMSDSGANPKIGEFLVAEIKKLSKVQVTMTVIPQAQATTELRNRNYQMVPYAYLGPDPEPQFYESWHSKGTRNFSGYANTAVDDALVRARNATDTATRKKEYTSVQKALIDDGVPMILTQRSKSGVVYKPGKVNNLAFFEDGGVWFDRVWLKK